MIKAWWAKRQAWKRVKPLLKSKAWQEARKEMFSNPPTRAVSEFDMGNIENDLHKKYRINFQEEKRVWSERYDAGRA